METLIQHSEHNSILSNRLQTLDDACQLPLDGPGVVPIECILSSDERGQLSILKDLCSRHGYDLSQPDHHRDDIALL